MRWWTIVVRVVRVVNLQMIYGLHFADNFYAYEREMHEQSCCDRMRGNQYMIVIRQLFLYILHSSIWRLTVVDRFTIVLIKAIDFILFPLFIPRLGPLVKPSHSVFTDVASLLSINLIKTK